MNALVVVSHADSRPAGQNGLCLHSSILPHAGDAPWGEHRFTVLVSPAGGGAFSGHVSVWNSLTKLWVNQEPKLRRVVESFGSWRRLV